MSKRWVLITIQPGFVVIYLNQSSERNMLSVSSMKRMLTVQFPFEISIYKNPWPVCYYCLTRVSSWLSPIHNIIHACSHDIINQNLNLELHSKNVIERKNVSLYAKANRISCYNTVYLIYRGVINYFDLKMSLLISKVNQSGVLQQHVLSCVTAAHFKY